MKVEQYPHYLFSILGGESVQDDEGNWSDSETTTEFISVCREEHSIDLHH